MFTHTFFVHISAMWAELRKWCHSFAVYDVECVNKCVCVCAETSLSLFLYEVKEAEEVTSWEEEKKSKILISLHFKLLRLCSKCLDVGGSSNNLSKRRKQILLFWNVINGVRIQLQIRIIMKLIEILNIWYSHSMSRLIDGFAQT